MKSHEGRLESEVERDITRLLEKNRRFIPETRNTMQWLSSRCYTAGALIPPPLFLYQPSTDQGQIWYTGVGPHILLNCPILPSSVDSVATYCGKTLQNYEIFNFRLLSSLVAPPSLLHKKSNVSAHLQTFPYPTVPDLFLNSNSFMVIWCSQSLSFQKHDRQKNKKTSQFLLPGSVRSPSPTKLGGMVIEEVCPILGGLKHVPQGALKILGENASHIVKLQ